jgi:hypothetical protein
MGWATFWPTFSQTHLATLFENRVLFFSMVHMSVHFDENSGWDVPQTLLCLKGIFFQETFPNSKKS